MMVRGAEGRAGLSILGPISQLAYVPADFESALKFWTKTMGVGPFYHMPHIDVPAMWYKGKSTKIDFSLALSYWGEIQIELVEQHDDTPSIFSDWKREGRDGLHHVCQLVDDIDQAKRLCSESGAVIVQELALRDGQAIYVDTHGGPGTMVEMLQAPPSLLRLFDVIRSAGRDWDGTDPLRLL